MIACASGLIDDTVPSLRGIFPLDADLVGTPRQRDGAVLLVPEFHRGAYAEVERTITLIKLGIADDFVYVTCGFTTGENRVRLFCGFFLDLLDVFREHIALSIPFHHISFQFLLCNAKKPNNLMTVTFDQK